ncbi:MAG: adenine deaminase C-terminal domain-containing protein, partial [Oscillospiraceae bacterium]
YRLSPILTDHECSTFEEALDKLRAGMHILIREGSGAQNLEAIVSGMLEHELPFDCCSFCTDDKHISDIDTLGHVNHCVNRAISLGMHPVYAIKAATINTARRYGLHDVGAVSAGMRADIIVTDNLEKIEPEIVFKDGNAVSSSMFDAFEEFPVPEPLRHSVLFDSLTTKRIAVEAGDSNHVIGTVQGQLLTEHLVEHLPQREGIFQPNKLYNKLVTAERHGKNGNIAACALKGFGIERGAMATSCSHDSHNVVAVGDNDADIITATDRLRELQGGYVVVREGKVTAELSLPIGGLITDACGAEVSRRTSTVIAAARALGIPDGIDPLTNLSFMALPVMPSLRLLDTGLFDVDTYRLI